MGKKVKVAMLSPDHDETIKAVAEIEKKGYEVARVIASQNSLEKAWSRYKDLSFSTETKAGALDVSSSDIETFTKNIHSTEEVRASVTEILKLKKAFRISKILEIVLGGALATNASDIHIEPEEEYARLRYRLDGVLTDIINFDLETFALLLSRIKLLSGLKLNVKSEAQDGRFSIKLGDTDIEIRTSMLPGAYSESVVLRILNPKSIQVSLESLGIPTRLWDVIQKEISKPNGMVLTTGPTGSGKTTTLYAFLRKIHTPDVKIITIEDPIEYHLPGIVQTQVNSDKGYTFALGLRSAMRQDPDVIMVGEIRDEETAKTAIDSAETGHLVFSTLHTNSAAGAYTRLIDLGINPKTMTSAINVVLAQRLIRKLCPFCKKEVPLEGITKKHVDDVLKGIYDQSSIAGLQREKMWSSVGCDKCNKSGFKGRIGIYEGVMTDDVLEKAVQEDPSERNVKRATKVQGILDMREDGIIKILSGITSIDELERVIDIEEA
jgi:type IV pilus assembly protein PilB